MWAVSSLAVIFFGVVGVGAVVVDCGTVAFPFLSGQSRLRWPSFLHLKLPPLISGVFVSAIFLLVVFVVAVGSGLFCSSRASKNRSVGA